MLPTARPGNAPELRAQRTAALVADLSHARSEAEQRRLRDDVVVINLPVATSVAMRYRDRGEPLDDLIQVAHLGLVKAARGFDPQRGPDFLSYAVPTIRGEVRRHFRDRGWDIRPPRRVQELRVQVEEASAVLAQRLDRSPRPSEIAAHLDVDPSLVIECLASGDFYHVHSLDAPGDGDTDDGSAGPSAAAALGAEDPALATVDALVSLRPLVAALPPRDRQILALRFWHGWTQARIAEEIGVTQMQVSRLLSQALRRLRTRMEVD
ncbi:MAG: SigB/SigF/SigG family RNA polymerase sigma factor [Kineosporiaceae bacterium]